MRNCFVPGCDRHCRINGTIKRKMFVVPKDEKMLSTWIEILPKLRELKAHDKVCERHFNEDDICTTYDNRINGFLVKMERGRARLKPNAVPSRNLEVDQQSFKRKSSLTNNESKKIKVVNVASLVQNQQEQAKDEQQEQEEQQNLQDHNEHDVIEEHHEEPKEQEEQQFDDDEDGEEVPLEDERKLEQIITNSDGEVMFFVSSIQNENQENNDQKKKVHELFDTLYNDIYEITLPNTLWAIHRCPIQTAFFFSFIDTNLLRTSKLISVSSNGEVKVFFGSRLINERQLIVHINSMEVLNDLINDVDEALLCSKMFVNDFCEITLKDEKSEACEACLRFEHH